MQQNQFRGFLELHVFFLVLFLLSRSCTFTIPTSPHVFLTCRLLWMCPSAYVISAKSLLLGDARVMSAHLSFSITLWKLFTRGVLNERGLFALTGEPCVRTCSHTLHFHKGTTMCLMCLMCLVYSWVCVSVKAGWLCLASCLEGKPDPMWSCVSPAALGSEHSALCARRPAWRAQTLFTLLIRGSLFWDYCCW